MAAAVSIGIRSAATDWALRRDFARLLVIAVVLPALILCALLAWSQATSRRADATTQLRSAAVITGRGFDEFLRVHGAVAALVAARRSAEGTLADRARWVDDLNRLRDNYPTFASMRAIDAHGTVIASDPAERITGAAGPCFAQAEHDNGPAFSDVYRAKPNSEPLACVAGPLRTANGTFAGIVEGAMRVETFSGQRVAWLRSHGYEAVLVDRKGQVAYASSGTTLSSMDVLDATPAGQALRAVAPGEVDSEWTRVEGVLHDDGDA